MKWTGSKVLVLLIAAVFVAAGLAYSIANQNAAIKIQQVKNELAQEYSQQIASLKQKMSVVELDITQSGGKLFNLSENISSDGSSTPVTKELALTVFNPSNRTVTVNISLKNPVTGEIGLPSDLQKSAFEMFIVYNNAKKYIYWTPETTGTSQFGSLQLQIQPGTQITLYVGVQLLSSVQGTFQPNTNYTVTLYFSQPGTNYVQSVQYNVRT